MTSEFTISVLPSLPPQGYFYIQFGIYFSHPYGDFEEILLYIVLANLLYSD